MNDLPAGWTSAVLPELIAADGVFIDGDWVESKDQDPNGGVRLTQLADVGDGSYRNRSARYLTQQKAHQLRCTILQPGDVLIARMPEPLGRACIFPGDPMPCVTVVDVCIVRPGQNSVNPRWLMHTINAPQFRRSVAALEKGTTRKRISRGNLALIALPIPPRMEQDRIVDAIEEQFSRLESGVAALERVIGQLTHGQSGRVGALRRAVLAAAVAGKLDTPDPSDLPATEFIRQLMVERSHPGVDQPRRRRTHSDRVTVGE